MLTLKLLLTATGFCTWGDKSNVTCSDDAKSACCVVISGDKTPGCCSVSVGDGGQRVVFVGDDKKKIAYSVYRTIPGKGLAQV